jgi:predicted N-acetyltransferase YhbS
VGASPAPWAVEAVDASALWDLRRRVLRDGRTDLSVHRPADDDPETTHLAVRDQLGHVVGCATACWEPYPLRPDRRRARRLLMMAVLPDRQGQGLGRALVEAILDDARRREAPLVWATARDGALGFYAALGFLTEGEGFVGVMGLPHHHICREP